MVKAHLTHKYLLAVLLLLIATTSAAAQDRLCDTAFEDCRTPVWQLIDNETVGIDIAFWFMDDTSYVPKIIAKWQSGVPVRVLVDPRASATHPVNQQVLDQLAAAGIPMRKNVAVGGVLHWKMMLFVGQNTVQFSAANYGPQNFVPTDPFNNYIDELIYFTSISSLVNSFKTKYDDKWLDTNRFANYANITTPLTRKYPIFTKDSELCYPPEESFANRSVSQYNQETQKIDAMIFRNTDDRHTDAFIAALGRGVPVRILNEPETYRTTTYFRHAYNIDRMFMAGAQIKDRLHLGLTHEKLVLLYSQGMAIFGSSNMSVPSSDSQDEHNVFTQRSTLFNYLTSHFDRKWNSTTEYKPFTPLPPDAPVNPSPANNSITPSTNVTLQWEGGFWAWKYDVYFGTTPDPPLLTANLNTGFPGPNTPETFQLPVLQPGTTYYWRIVGKTMANMTTSGPVWSFTVPGSGTPPSAPSGLMATAVGTSQITLTWGNVANEAGYRIERSLSPDSGFQDIGSTVADTTSFPDTGLASGTTYFYRVLAFNGGGTSPYSNTANATTQTSSTGPPPGVLLADDFNDNSLDSSKWSFGQITGSADPSILVAETSQRLNVGPLLQGTSGFHFNGVFSNLSYDFTGASVYLQVVTPPPAGSTSELRLSVAGSNSPAGNIYRFIILGSNLKLQKVIGGSAVNVVPPFAYNATSMKFLRIRHDAVSGNVIFETAPASASDPNLPGAWSIRYQEAWTNWNGSSGVLLSSVKFEVRIGTASADPVAAGTLSLDNFKAIRPAPLPSITSVSPTSGPEAGGTQVSISGENFSAGSTVHFGGIAATNVNVMNANLITARTPTHTNGTVDVVVTTVDLQTATLSNGFTFLSANDPGNEPPQVSASASPISGPAPLNVTFTSNASDPDGSIMSYSWTFGDGGTSTLQSPSHIYQQPGTYVAQVTVTDDMGATSNALVTITVNTAGETVLLADDFNDNSLDSSKWSFGQITGSADPSILVAETSQRLNVGPLLQGTSGFHFNGVFSNLSYDFTGAYAYLQVVTPPPAGSTSELRWSVAGSNSPAGNIYRFIILGSNLKLQKVIGGSAVNVIAPFAYNATSMKFLRIRHDAVSGNVIFETAPASASDPNLPGAWSIRYQEAWTNWNGSSGVLLSSVKFEVRIGTATADPVASGVLSADNLRVARP